MLFQRFIIWFWSSPTISLHAPKVKKHFNFLIKYLEYHSFFNESENGSFEDSVSLKPSFLQVYSALIGQMAHSFGIGLPLTETKHLLP